jgi:hypothetical protein
MSTLPLHCTVVANAPQAVWLPDGTAVHLHRVETPSARAVGLRALRRPGGWQVVDISRIAPELRDELPGAPERDVPGLVLYALRAACPTAEAFLAAAARAADAGLTRLANAEDTERAAA